MNERKPSGIGVRRCLSAVLLLIGLGCLTGCRSVRPSDPLQRYEFTHPAMGTLFTITLFAPGGEAARAGTQAAFARIDALEDILSDYQADSELLRLCDQPCGKPVLVSADLFDVLEQSQRVSKLSSGAFDVTVGPYVRLWRFARKRKVLAAESERAAAASAVGYQKLRLDPRARTATLLAPNMRLDAGGIAKGYAADQALKVLKSRGIKRALVAASGDLALGEPPPGQSEWKIGVSGIDAGTNEVGGKLLLKNCGISTSGDTEQSILIDGIRYSHILDPATGLGLTNRIQATVIARDATTTDALATTVCVLGAHRGLALVDSMRGTAALVLTKENGVVRTFPSRRFEEVTRAEPGR
jgi:thiamine biosynthesis lipoprotein